MSEAAMRCAACGLEPFPADAPRDHETGLPSGWYRHVIARRTFVLCECCGDIRHFKGGISLYLQEMLGLPPHAELDSAASGEVGSGLHRLRRQR